MPLVEPLEDGQYPAELADFFNVTLGGTPNSVRTMAYRPEIARAFTALNIAVMQCHVSMAGETCLPNRS